MGKVDITIETGLVRIELQKILESEAFQNSRILSTFLEFVVEKKLDGCEDQLKEYTIAVTCLNKDKDFNPQVDAYVRIHAHRLRDALTRYYFTVGKDDPLVIEMPKGSYRPIFQSRSGIIELPAHSQIPTVDRASQHSHFKKPVLTVLPFRNLSEGNSRDFFVRGLGEQMSSELARFQHVSVISYFASPNNSEPDNLYQLKLSAGIDYVIAGSVRLVGDMVRLNIHMCSTENSQIVFSESFSRELTDKNIFNIQEEIVGEVINAIADDKGVIVMNQFRESASTEENSPVKEAIRKYFRYACHYNVEEFPPTLGALQKAVASEPQNALVSALLSDLCMARFVNQVDSELSLLAKAKELALAAVRSDGQCQHAQKALAWAYLLSGQKEKSLETIEECTRLNPNASGTISSMALAYICQGEFEPGLKWLQYLKKRNAIIHEDAKLAFAIYFFYEENFPECIGWLERLSNLGNLMGRILRLALAGRGNHHDPRIVAADLSNLVKHSENIVTRFIQHPELREKILSRFDKI